MNRKPSGAGVRRLLSRVDRRLLVRVVTLGTTAFLVGYALIALLFIGGGRRPAVVSVPDLREMSVAQARRALGRVGLELQVGDSVPHAELSRGAVLAQSPLPGNEVAPGSKVRVIVSSGRDRRPVPDVGSLPQQQASRILTGAGFRVALRQVPDQRPAGRVVGVEPAAGTMLPLAATVRLLVSAGPPFTVVPSVVGMMEEEARAALQAARLQVGNVEHDFEASGAPGEVLTQSPAAGDSVRVGSSVSLSVVAVRTES